MLSVPMAISRSATPWMSAATPPPQITLGKRCSPVRETSG